MDIQATNTNPVNSGSVTSAPVAANANPASVTSFASLLDGSNSPAQAVPAVAPSLLTTASASRASRPDVKTFMDATGASLNVATQLVYGVIGSNTDLRDWSSIMASKDPVSAARSATAALYAGSDNPPNLSGTYMDSTDTLGKAGNFAVRLKLDNKQNIVDSGVKLIDNKGLILRDGGGSAQEIAQNAWFFGFDVAPVAQLQSAAAQISPALASAVQNASSIKISSLGELLSPATAAQTSTVPAPTVAQTPAIVDPTAQSAAAFVTPKAAAAATPLSAINTTANNILNLVTSVSSPTDTTPAVSSLLPSPATVALSQAQSSAALLNNLLNNSDAAPSSPEPVVTTSTASNNSAANSDANAPSSDQAIPTANDLIKLVTQAVGKKSMSTLDRILSIGG